MIGWFDARAAHEFGQELAAYYMERMPTLAEESEGKRGRATRQEALDGMQLRIAQFKQNNKLNVFKKAKLGNAFRWALQEAGYPPETVSDMTNFVVVNL